MIKVLFTSYQHKRTNSQYSLGQMLKGLIIDARNVKSFKKRIPTEFQRSTSVS